MIIPVFVSSYLLKENDEFTSTPPPPPHMAIIVLLFDNLYPFPFENDSIGKEEVKTSYLPSLAQKATLWKKKSRDISDVQCN